MVSLFYYILRNSRSFIIRRIINKIANLIIPVWFYLTPSPKLDNSNNEITVSLTSFPQRIKRIHLVVESLLRQTIKPGKILLYLSKEQFKHQFKDLPSNLLRLQSMGLQIKFVDNDYRSHKKYLYSFREYPESLIITVDDDMIYNKDLLESLIKNKRKGKITANYVHGIRYNSDGSVKSYVDWISNKSPADKYILGSGGGAAFIPSELYPDILDIELSQNLAPWADDLWLSAMAILNNMEIEPTNYPQSFIIISNKNNKTLFEINKIQNDVQIDNINRYYYAKIGRRPFHK